MSNVTIQVLPHQEKFINDTSQVIGLVAGFGSGKSIAATIRMIKLLINSRQDVAYYLPTYSLIRDIAFKNFDYWLTVFQIPFVKNQTSKEYYTAFGKIILRSVDRPEFIIGYEVAHSIIDEADILPKNKMYEVFKNILARNRAVSKDDYNSVSMVSTPEGYNFMYDYFQKKKKGKLIRASTYDNPFLPDNYIESLESDYDEKQIRAYLMGEFVNLTTGNVTDFNREKHTTEREIQKNDVLHIGLDFNVGNMSAVIHIVENGVAYAVDEIVKVLNTYEMAEKIKSLYPGHRIAIYPDASGNARKTSATKTDFQILREAGFVVKTTPKNPFVNQRVKHFNYNLRNGRYKVNVNRCINYIESLEQLAYDKGGGVDKKSGYDHLFDAGSYFVWKFFKKNTILIR